MEIITVSQLNRYLKSTFDENKLLNSIYIVGEVSNFRGYRPNGHLYFTLKDENAQLKAVMFSSFGARLKFALEDGMRVICRGRVSVYETAGVYQLYVEDIQPDGAGALAIAFEQLKNRLEAEGLFSDAHKKHIPAYPQKIGIATSATGAAVEDMKNIISRRYPLAEIIIAPTVVQGNSAPADIVDSLRRLDEIEDMDVIIVGRGGGSIEDLWAFNTEEVARAVYNCKTPVVSAVGHETDYTICDFVADLRAETPSAAAEKITPDINELINRINNYKEKMTGEIRHKLFIRYQRLDYVTNESVLSGGEEYLRLKRSEILEKNQMVVKAFEQSLKEKRHHLTESVKVLEALNPLSILMRGYAYASASGVALKNADGLKKNDKISLRLTDAEVKCTVDEINKYS